MALLPRVVNVGRSTVASWSQGTREARFPTSSSQPGIAVPLTFESQHHTLRMSVLG